MNSFNGMFTVGGSRWLAEAPSLSMAPMEEIKLKRVDEARLEPAWVLFSQLELLVE